VKDRVIDEFEKQKVLKEQESNQDFNLAYYARPELKNQKYFDENQHFTKRHD